MDNTSDATTQFAKQKMRCASMFALVSLFMFGAGLVLSCPLHASWPIQDNDTGQVPQAGDPPVLTETQKIEADQKRLADRYRLLEEKLFSLHEFETGNNPMRSKLLERAFLQSQENMTASQMKLIVKLLSNTKLKDAENEQRQVLVQLNELLGLLQSEDRGKRVRDEIQRHQEYLKEVERILRIQKGVRGQTEGGVDAKRLANSENKTADRTQELAAEMLENEERNEQIRETAEEVSGKSSSDQKAPEGGDSKHAGESESKDARDKDSYDNPSSGDNNAKPGKGESSQKSEPGKQENPGEQRENGGTGAGSDQPMQTENPTRKRIQAAEHKMRDAQQKLEEARREEAVEAMKAAEREMGLAKQELEEILRQLREEEIERTLAMLEGRFRQMLERQIRVYESTRKLDRVVTEQRGTDFEIRAGKLSVEQNSNATEAGRALLLLREDGSSVAFPATVHEMHQDMLQVASRLSAARIGRITIEIEEDIIDTLEYLVKALVKTQQDMERMKQQQQAGQGGQPGDKPLVDQLAEIKMLRGLQERIFRRHSRYARFLDDPDDPVGETEDPDLQAALRRLAKKQAQLTEIARDIVSEKNK